MVVASHEDELEIAGPRLGVHAQRSGEVSRNTLRVALDPRGTMGNSTRAGGVLVRRVLLARKARQIPVEELCDQCGRTPPQGPFLEFATAPDDLVLEKDLHGCPPRLFERGRVAELSRERHFCRESQGRRPRGDPDVCEPDAHVLEDLVDVGRREAIDLVDEDLYGEPCALRLLEDGALALLYRLRGVDQPDRNVRLLERHARDLRVTEVV
jgi:hypothetical protein